MSRTAVPSWSGGVIESSGGVEWWTGVVEWSGAVVEWSGGVEWSAPSLHVCVLGRGTSRQFVVVHGQSNGLVGHR